MGMVAKASQEIESQRLEDTFYVRGRIHGYMAALLLELY